MDKPGFHEALDRDEVIAGPSDRRFGLTIAAVCAAIGAVRLAIGHNGWWWLAAAAILCLAVLLRPAILAPLNRLWLRLGLLLYKVINPVVMAVVYYTTVTPIGLLRRALGHDPLRLRRDPQAASYWIVRVPPGPAPGTMKNQF